MTDIVFNLCAIVALLAEHVQRYYSLLSVAVAAFPPAASPIILVWLGFAGYIYYLSIYIFFLPFFSGRSISFESSEGGSYLVARGSTSRTSIEI